MPPNMFPSIFHFRKQMKELIEQNQNLRRENEHLRKYILKEGSFAETDYKRWIDLGNHQEGWNSRTEMMAQMIEERADVIEFGAGRKILKEYLDRKGCSYQPSDCVDRGDNTLVLDLNDTTLPPMRKCDYAVFSGVIEYITDVPRLAEWLNTFAEKIILSYAAVEEDMSDELVKRRKASGWLNHYYDHEIRDIFNRKGFILRNNLRWEQGQERQNIYVFTSSKIPA